MLKVKLPTNPSPPKMSIHWSMPWPNMEYHERLMKKSGMRQRVFGPIIDTDGHEIDFGDDSSYTKQRKKDFEEQESFFDGLLVGNIPNWKNAVGIFYQNERIRVFPHEFSKILKDNFRIYLEDDTFELIPNVEAEKQFMDKNLSKGQRFIYDAAQVDGCNNYEAMMVAMGRYPQDEPPPMGWYKLREEYANIFCYAEEQRE